MHEFYKVDDIVHMYIKIHLNCIWPNFALSEKQGPHIITF